ncbi:MAG: lysylphosphatidylglycerol synthase domain-containing protein [Acidimicrobiales bacterium]
MEPVPASEEQVPGSAWRVWVRRLYGIGLVVAAVAVAVSQRDKIGDLVSGTRPAPLVAALALGMVSLVQAAWFWSRALAGLGRPRPVSATLEATVASIPARYVPGSVWYAAGRVTHLRTSGSPAVPLAIVAVLEALLSFMVAVALGFGLLVASGNDDGGIGIMALAVTAGVLTVAASPWVVNPLMGWAARRRDIDDVPELRWSLELELAAHLVAFWASSAAAFVLYLSAFPAVDTDGVLQTAGTFLLAWAAGFLAVFAPQGAGVFETAVATTLDGTSLGALAVVVGGYRAVTAVRDVLALVALAVVRTVAGR